MAGTAVDVTLFPLDTIKTRMQSSSGFMASGGFRGLSAGLKSAAIGSAPGAALFFTTYEGTKQYTLPYLQHSFPRDRQAAAQPISHMLAASAGEVIACLVRVPTENVKQKMQAGLHPTMSSTIRAVLAHERGVLRGLYTGYATTLMREIPFSLTQFPLYEAGKTSLRTRLNVAELQPWQAACVGSAAGAVAAALTTPIDVAKTRMMLGQTGLPRAGAVLSLPSVIQSVYRVGGVRGLFAGVQPRVMWIAIGGFVFFGVYEASHKLLVKVEDAV
jgi:solute carrier family 25 S-adenosylmethionine transporter 26